MKHLHIFLFTVAISCPITVFAALPARSIPTPLPDHPGNIFLHDESLAIAIPEALPSGPLRWRLLNDRETELASGALPARPPSRLSLNNPGIGWYRLEFLDSSTNRVAWTTAAVLARLHSPTPLDSPISLDAAISWFARDDDQQQERFANLAALAGVNWVRDRLRWRDIQPEPDRFADDTTYDSAADIQHRAGLQVLQVFHDTPPWARPPNTRSSRFAQDLRAVHRFTAAMARRFRGRIQAWEPWNEANVASFGAHTIDEMSSWQKAAWLGFKSADPQLIVGWNATAAVPTPQHTEGLLANSVAPYFDTYNIHTYDWPHDYDRLWTPALAAAASKPLWITEADRGMKHLNVAPDFDLPWPGERLKAEALVQEYALSLAAGAAQHFHFILGHYHEPNGVQFGLLRRDLTPRPAYVALAATGRFLAGARRLGHWRPGDSVTVVAFRAHPDGHERDVLVLWAENPADWDTRGQHTANNPLPPNLRIDARYDYLGRSYPNAPRIGSAPWFILLPAGEAERLPLQSPPPRPVHAAPPLAASPVILQILWPLDRRTEVTDLPWSEAHAYSFKPGQSVPLEVVLYNFSTQPLEGTLAVDALPSGWSFKIESATLRLEPGERLSLNALFLAQPSTATAKVTSDGWITLRGAFPLDSQPVVAFRCMKERAAVEP